MEKDCVTNDNRLVVVVVVLFVSSSRSSSSGNQQRYLILLLLHDQNMNRHNLTISVCLSKWQFAKTKKLATSRASAAQIQRKHGDQLRTVGVG